jgi:hypothetical protein
VKHQVENLIIFRRRKDDMFGLMCIRDDETRFYRGMFRREEEVLEVVEKFVKRLEKVGRHDEYDEYEDND